jgi:hypothetical protein
MLSRFMSVPYLRAWTIAFLTEILIICGLDLFDYPVAAAYFSAIATPTIMIVYLMLFIVGVKQRWW